MLDTEFCGESLNGSENSFRFACILPKFSLTLLHVELK